MNRIKLIDSVRGFAIILVVLGHSIQNNISFSIPSIHKAIYDLIYIFHMPLFFIISGAAIHISIRNKKLNNPLRSLIHSTLSLYIIYVTSYVLYFFMVDGYPLSMDLVYSILLSPSKGFWFIDTYLWLLLIGKLSLLIVYGKVNFKFVIIIPIFLLMDYFFQSLFGGESRINLVLYYLPYFILGASLPMLKDKLLRNSLLLGMFALQLIYLLSLPDFFVGNFDFLDKVLRYLDRFRLVFILSFFVVLIIYLSPGVFKRMFSLMGCISLEIYITHVLLIPYLSSAINPYIMFFTLLSISFLIIYLLCLLSMRYSFIQNLYKIILSPKIPTFS